METSLSASTTTTTTTSTSTATAMTTCSISNIENDGNDDWNITSEPYQNNNSCNNDDEDYGNINTSISYFHDDSRNNEYDDLMYWLGIDLDIGLLSFKNLGEYDDDDDENRSRDYNDDNDKAHGDDQEEENQCREMHNQRNQKGHQEDLIVCSKTDNHVVVPSSPPKVNSSNLINSYTRHPEMERSNTIKVKHQVVFSPTIDYYCYQPGVVATPMITHSHSGVDDDPNIQIKNSTNTKTVFAAPTPAAADAAAATTATTVASSRRSTRERTIRKLCHPHTITKSKSTKKRDTKRKRTIATTNKHNKKKMKTKQSETQQEKKKEKKVVEYVHVNEITKNDILFGRGSGNIGNHHPNKQQYLTLIKHYQQRYKRSNKLQRKEIVDTIINYIQHTINGRFLKRVQHHEHDNDDKNTKKKKKNQDDNMWYVVSNTIARTKISQCLRDNHDPIARKIKREKYKNKKKQKEDVVVEKEEKEE